MKEYLRAVGYAMITIVAVLFGMGLAEFGYLTAAVYFGLTKGQTAAAILGISLVAGAVKTARERRRQRSRCEAMEKAIRYDFLIERVRRGEIGDLRLQVDFTLQEAYTDAEGRRVRAIRYKADFTYRERDGGTRNHPPPKGGEAGKINEETRLKKRNPPPGGKRNRRSHPAGGGKGGAAGGWNR